MWGPYKKADNMFGSTLGVTLFWEITNRVKIVRRRKLQGLRARVITAAEVYASESRYLK